MQSASLITVEVTDLVRSTLQVKTQERNSEKEPWRRASHGKSYRRCGGGGFGRSLAVPGIITQGCQKGREKKNGRDECKCFGMETKQGISLSQ